MALQIHESCGHPLEFDRILGREQSLAGGSFVNTSDPGRLQYGSPHVTIVADSTVPGGLGSFGFDDEGMPACREVLIENGILKNVLTSRETAGNLNQAASNGSMRADGWRNLPLIRMTNINLEPGDYSLNELIRSVKQGIFFKTNTSWSIDDQRLNFQFATEIGFVIKNGSIVGIVKKPVYHGRTPQFWNSCAGIGNRESWQLWGINNCGKGDPIQIMRVGHGTPPALFRQVKVGI
jgi:TldD protein